MRRSCSLRKSSLLDELDELDGLHEQDLEDSPSSGKLSLRMRRSRDEWPSCHPPQTRAIQVRHVLQTLKP